MRFQGDVVKLHVHRRKYKTRFNANVHTIAEKLTDLDERIADANALYSSMSNRMDNTAPADVRAAMDAMEARITALSLDKATAQAADRVSLNDLQAMMTGMLPFRISPLQRGY